MSKQRNKSQHSSRRQARERESRRGRLKIILMLLLGGAIIGMLLYLNLRN